MANTQEPIWTASDWRAAAVKIAESTRGMTDAVLRQEFEEMALSGLRKADELEATKGHSRGLDPLTELLTRHP